MDRIGKKDRKVIEAFCDQHAYNNGHKLDTDGQKLDGLWMGGNRIAEWVDDAGAKLGRVVVFGPNCGRSVQFVQNQLRRALPALYLEESRAHRERGRK